MLKITRRTCRVFWDTKKPGRAVQVDAILPANDLPGGCIVISFERRLTPEVMKELRKIPQLTRTYRNKRLLVTEVGISPESALVLRKVLDAVIQEAKIVEEPDEENPST